MRRVGVSFFLISFQGPNAIYDIKGMTCVKMKGLPYQVDESMIFKFFEGLSVIGIFICRDQSGNVTGEGFCEFESLDDAQKAISRNKAHLGDRFIELIPYSKDDVLQAISDPTGRPRQAEYGMGGGGRGRGRGRGRGGYGGGYGGRGGYQQQQQVYYSQPVMMPQQQGYTQQQGYAQPVASGYAPVYVQQPQQQQQQAYGYRPTYGIQQQNMRGGGSYNQGRGRGGYGRY
mmetsp:Transcript_31203/g.40178  ORF Transcript_31203/g.40178 Transcript_31203/m.40178 type:complete len:230 (-) Transcript_31203:133-822(-)